MPRVCRVGRSGNISAQICDAFEILVCMHSIIANIDDLSFGRYAYVGVQTKLSFGKYLLDVAEQ